MPSPAPTPPVSPVSTSRTSSERNVRTCHKLLALQQQHGRIVRIGSSDLSITAPDFMESGYGPISEVRKPTGHAADPSMCSLFNIRDRAEHDLRRRNRAPASSDRASWENEPRIRAFNDRFVESTAEFRWDTGQCDEILQLLLPR